MQFKKLFLLLVVLVFLLAACSGESTPEATDTVVPTAETAPTEAAPTEAAPTEAAPTEAAPTEAVPTELPDTESSDETTDETSGVVLPEVDPLDLTGDIVVAGSSTVYPLTERMAELFTEEGFAGNITVDSIGSGAGFERFCVAGETDIANASRAINDEELASCEAINRQPIEFRVGTDALAVVVSKENDFATNITMEELVALFSTATNWSDVNPEWPNEPILRYIPGTDSGTFDYFVEEVFDKDKEPILAANPEMSEDDNVLVQGTLGSPYAVTFFGYAYYEENADNLNVLSVDGIIPDAESVNSAEYPLARPLFIYSTAEIMQEKPQVAGFINFLLTNVEDEIISVGYFPAQSADLDVAKQSWLDANPSELPDTETSDETSGVVLPEVDPLDLTGDIVVAGSSTVYPLTERMAELFTEEGFAGNITVDSIGSGAGFERFCVAGETDIANASRAINDEELASCEAINRQPIEFRVGTDALAVVVSKENDFATNITMEELVALFSTATNWSDVNPEWPNEPILRYIPGTDSGTFDYFVEEVFDKDKEPILAANPEMSEDDNVLVQGTLGSPYAVTFFGYAYYEENADNLNVLSVDGIIPDAESVNSAEYPLARPLFIYSTAEIMQEKPQVAGFINFLLTNVEDEIISVGYFPAQSADLDVAKQSWLDANP